MNEFDLITEYFRPLSTNYPGGLNLSDDAALVEVPPGFELAITKDAISQGVHFLGSEPADMIARKLLRTNLSDLAAMGAAPLAYFLALMLPQDTKPAWIKEFANGLAQDQAEYGITLAGGDTIATHGPLSCSITALGLVPKGKALKRSGARPGDLIYVSGTLGDSALGLDALQGRIARNDFLEQRYFLPQPRLDLGRQLLGIASACMDISDGLMQDLGHICTASGVGAVVQRDKIPLSPAVSALFTPPPLGAPGVKKTATPFLAGRLGGGRHTKDLRGSSPLPGPPPMEEGDLWERIIGGGDDYELLFTVPEEQATQLVDLAQALHLPLTCIGAIHQGQGMRLLDGTGEALNPQAGYSHF